MQNKEVNRYLESRKVWPWVQNEAGQRLTEFCQENTLVIVNTLFQQHKRRLYTWTSPDGQHQNQMDYILSSQRWRSSIQSAKTRPGADCGLDHELSEVAQSCPTLSDPMDCSLLCSSVHGIFQARILEWAAISFTKQSLLLNHFSRVRLCVTP